MNTRTALITGANKGIGLETGRQLAAEGYRIILGYRDKARGEETLEQLHQEGITAVEGLVIDVTKEESVQSAFTELSARIPRLDVLVNNAGIPGQFGQLPSAATDDNLHQVFETNFFGVIRVIRVFMELLRKSERPRIVNVTSDLASLTFHNDPGWQYYAYKSAAYGPSKTALNAYTVALAYELRDTSFKVNAVNPGYTATDFNQHRGTKTVQEAAAIITKYAMLEADGPTGKFVSDYGETPW
jgi:NAD(P)-dependent dehydrogenase (short-subunit alcohol dehydrogenase family)